eukprot:1975648-Pleurochrysis_carterae.AAC.1
MRPPSNSGRCITIALPRPEMDALMRARDIAARHAQAEAAARHAPSRVPPATATARPGTPAASPSEHAIPRERDASSPTAPPA